MKREYQVSRKPVTIPRQIIFTQMEITAQSEIVLGLLSDDKPLIEAICDCRKKIEKEGKEVHARKRNALVTEDGYIFAIYEDTIKKDLQ